jgi:hypothetical protein
LVIVRSNFGQACEQHAGIGQRFFFKFFDLLIASAWLR